MEEEDKWQMMMVKLVLMNLIDRNNLKNRMLDLDKKVVERMRMMMMMMMAMMVAMMVVGNYFV